MKVESIETNRLRGERIRESHWQFWQRIGSNPSVMATLGGVWNEEKARKKLQWNCDRWNNYGHGQWIFFDKLTGQFVGRGGIRKVILTDREEVELGYSLMPEFWGQGLATEIGEKAVSIAFQEFSYSSVVGYTLVDNQKSERVLQRLGFSFERNIIYNRQPHVLYRAQNPNSIDS
jgi:[ribosomal protein S5]-alanine N-acetyltransferase